MNVFSVFQHLQQDKQRKQRHSLKLGKKRREKSKRNYYIISPRVIIKAIIIILAPPLDWFRPPGTEGEARGRDYHPSERGTSLVWTCLGLIMAGEHSFPISPRGSFEGAKIY